LAADVVRQPTNCLRFNNWKVEDKLAVDLVCSTRKWERTTPSVTTPDPVNMQFAKAARSSQDQVGWILSEQVQLMRDLASSQRIDPSPVF